MRIATWNVNSLRVRMEHLGRWLAANAVDAIALQELKLADEHFPRADFEAMGLHAVCYGQKTYNGVAIVAQRTPGPSRSASRATPTRSGASSPRRWGRSGS